jgi:(E)-4-hydroxy-3-methylbut-2-enyl-diphosphate synthase
VFKDYCPSTHQTKRRVTRSVFVGHIGIGSAFPVRVQSMTTTDTRDVSATAAQIMHLADVGCEIARVTVQGKKEAQACGEIKNLLVKKGYAIPLVADIHFYPPAALEVADYVEKVRINPGNFADKRAQFKQISYTDESYGAELEKIEERLTPLVEKCKRLKRVLRIGTNHGSLSDRIMNRFGDTPKGMVESALEYTRICRKLGFHDLVFSMKSSHTQVMIEAYRMLVHEMDQHGWDYPLHLGVTEAGEGREGRVKSAMGIGSLLLDGLGDTIRISLTEDPHKEIPPCKKLVSFAESYLGKGCDPFEETSRGGKEKEILPPLHPQGSVGVRVTEEEIASPDFYTSLGLRQTLGQLERTDSTVDLVLTASCHSKLEALKKAGVPVMESYPEIFSTIGSLVHEARRYATTQPAPFLIEATYAVQGEELYIQAGAELGALLCDYIGEGVILNAPVSLNERRLLGFTLLQGARRRLTKTEFISCPSCGRTLFDLQEVSARIRARTEHLKGVKIAIMGCIVNGPGEMADADFGYVGSKPGCIDLYVGKTCVEKNIPMADADQKLVELIQREGSWVEPVK